MALLRGWGRMSGDQRVPSICYHDHRGDGQVLIEMMVSWCCWGWIGNEPFTLLSESLKCVQPNIERWDCHLHMSCSKATPSSYRKRNYPCNLISCEFTILCWIASIVVLGIWGSWVTGWTCLAGRGFLLLTNSVDMQQLAIARTMFYRDKKTGPAGSCQLAIRKLRQEDHLQIQGQPGLLEQVQSETLCQYLIS